MNLEQLLDLIRIFFPEASMSNYKIRVPGMTTAADQIKAWVTLLATNNKMQITRDEDGSWLLYFDKQDINQPEPLNTRKREDQIEKPIEEATFHSIAKELIKRGQSDLATEVLSLTKK